MQILFWNLNKKDLRQLVVEAASEHTVDVVVLLESGVPADEMVDVLRSNVSPTFFAPHALPSRFQLYSRSSEYNLREVYSGNRISLRKLAIGADELLLGAIHVVDKLNWDEANQLVEVQLLSSEIRDVEQQQRNDRTVLIGDFNMNPFDTAMNIAAGMNSMMTQQCVEAGTRTVQERTYPFFYNPMWSLLGDRNPGPAGTYYHGGSSQGMYGWNMLDQVLIRPSAVECFGGVEILAAIGDVDLRTRKGRPNKSTASDHLPILLTLK